MRLRTKATAYGISGLVLAGIVIFSGSALGLLNTRSSGALSVMLTDPPSVPDGVTAVYITYSDIAVHAAGFGDSGWVTISGQGTIDTMKLVNFSQTISIGTVPSLTYNLVAFNISNVKVEFMGKNYTATTGDGRLTVPIVGGLKINSSSLAATLVDIQPTIINLGNESSPSFTMAAGARALQVPTDEVNESMKNVGSSFPLQGRNWYQSFRESHSEVVTISGLTLTASSFSFSATNTGSDPATVRMVVVTPTASGKSGEGTGAANSFIFTVESDGSLKLLNGTPGQVAAMLDGSGYSLAGGASHGFTFSGEITSLLGNHSVVSGETYIVAVVGTEQPSNQTVVAS